MSDAERYYFRIDDLAHAEGEDSELAFTGSTAETFASEFQQSLREHDLFTRWRDKQDDPDAVPDSLSPADPDASVEATPAGRYTEVTATTNLPHAVVSHRLTLLIGRNWTLRDVRSVD